MVATDSEGQPWAGRTLPPGGFEGDTGASDPAVLAAMARDDRVWMEVAAAARFLVAVVARTAPVPAGSDSPQAAAGPHGPRHGLPVDRGADMSLVTLTGPDGVRALPAFTGVGTLAAWDGTARPVPVTAAHLARSAIAERCDVIVVDPGAVPTRVLRPSQVWALAQQRAWLPPEEDPFVGDAVAAAAGRVEEIVDHAVFAGEPAGQGVLGVELTLARGLDRRRVEAVVTRLGEALATDGEFRARIDGLVFRLR